MSVVVRKGAFLTLVQDLGRPGWQRFGISAGGAADPFAARVANLLVGNPPNAALLEMTVGGPELVFEQESLIAVCGAAAGLQVDGTAVGGDRPVRVPAGGCVTFQGPFQGCRAWFAVAGGVAVSAWLGSRSTDLRAGQGGLEGRALATGDVLLLGEPSARSRRLLDHLRAQGCLAARWSVRLAAWLPRAGGTVVRVLPGPEWERFKPAARDRFFDTPFVVTKEADRMGLRLEGPALELAQPLEPVSSAVLDGVVQVPPNGQPILLLTDRQTVGGYPRIAVAARVDLVRVAQLRPGDRVRFAGITVQQAHQLSLERERDLRLAQTALEAEMA